MQSTDEWKDYGIPSYECVVSKVKVEHDATDPDDQSDPADSQNDDIMDPSFIQHDKKGKFIIGIHNVNNDD